MSQRRRQFLQVACAIAAYGMAPWWRAAGAEAATGSVALWAGDLRQHGHLDGPGEAARLFDPRGLCSDPRSGAVLVADSANATLRRIAADGSVTTLAGVPELRKTVDGPAARAGFVGPDALALAADGTIYVADSYANTLRVLRDGQVSLLAGADQLPGYADGTGAQARFNHPVGIALDPRRGHLLVADAYNHTLRKVDRHARVSTLGGTPGINDYRDGPLRHALFNTPVGIAVHADGSIYVSEYFNHDIRRISPQGEVSTVAGLHGQPGDADGAAGASRLRHPQQIAFDAGGALLIADAGNRLLRALGSDGVLRTVAGREDGEIAVPGPLPTALGPLYGVAPGPRGTVAVSSGEAVLLVRAA